MSDVREGGAKSVEDLAVFEKAYAISLEVHKLSLDFPRVEQFALADQIRRASKSICANIAEGFGRQAHSKPEFCRFLMMAMGSADEMQVWGRYCFDLGYIDEDRWHRWREGYQEVARMLRGLSSAVRRSGSF